jgi:hypothetical protein
MMLFQPATRKEIIRIWSDPDRDAGGGWCFVPFEDRPSDQKCCPIGAGLLLEDKGSYLCDDGELLATVPRPELAVSLLHGAKWTLSRVREAMELDGYRELKDFTEHVDRLLSREEVLDFLVS